MIDEQLEFRISQLADGTLPAEDVAALEREISENAEALAVLEAYRKLDGAMKRELALPQINWDQFENRLSRAVRREDERLNRPLTYPGWWTRTAAVAALIAIAIGTAALWPRGGRAQHDPDGIAIGPPVNTLPANAIVEVGGPMPEVASGQPVVDVSFDATPLAKQGLYGTSETIVYRPPHVTIASGPPERQDTSTLPY